MSKTKKILVSTLVAIVMILSAFALMGFTTADATAYAESNYFSDSDYTDSDNLLQANGKPSSKTIQTFSNEVKAARVNTAFPELSQVVPLEYLESSVTEDIFQHYGKEYGFYMVKEGEYFDLLLIDFVYTFDDGVNYNNQYKIRIKPILQQSFQRTEDSDGNYTWKKYGTGRDTYYVANPRFLSVLQNENSLNYGDNKYNKLTDDGLIIQQSRVNYGKISYKTEGDFWEEALSFVGDQILDVGLSVALGPVYGTVATLIKDIIAEGANLYNESKEVTIQANNEANISTKQSKTDQRNNASLPTYSRTAGFLPKEEIILSAAEDSYAEFIVLLNDTNYKSRLTQICDFDIVRRPDSYSSMEYVEKDNADCTLHIERKLFKDQEPQFSLTQNDVDLNSEAVYLLPEGEQTIYFTPEYTGNYTLKLGQAFGVNIAIDAQKDETATGNNEFKLYGGKEYPIILNNTSEQKIISDLGITLTPNRSTGQINKNDKQIVKVKITQDEVYNFTTGNNDVSIYNILVIEDNNYQQYSAYSNYVPKSDISLPAPENTYYFILDNSSSAAKNFGIEYSDCYNGYLDTEFTVKGDGENYSYYKIDINTYGKYVCTPTKDTEVKYKVLDQHLEGVDVFKIEDNCSFNIAENLCDYMYIGFLVNGEVSFIVNHTGVAYKWTIDKTIVNNTAAQPLNVGHSYELNFYVNNIAQDPSKIHLEPSNNDEYISAYVNQAGKCILKIEDNCPVNLDYTIYYYGENEERPYNYDLEIATALTTDFKGINNATNSETVTFSWTNTADITKVYYYVQENSSPDNKAYGEYTIPTNSTGHTTVVDITSLVETVQKNIDNITIVIYRLDIRLSESVRSLYKDFSISANVVFGGGNGTSGSPFIISCNRHFENLGLSKSRNNYFKINKHLELEGNMVETFKGVIDNNKTVSLSWTPKDEEEMGIIINNEGTIRNLQVHINYNFNLSGMFSHTVGGIVCYNKNGGIIENCSVTSMTADKFNFICVAGGIAGVNYGTIRDCWATADVTTYGTFGVITGINYGTITDCVGSGNITQKMTKYEGEYELSYVGGIAGINKSGGKISDCIGGSRDDSYLRVVIDVDYVDDEDLAPYSGPIAGLNEGAIEDCSNNRYSIDTGNLHHWWVWITKFDQLRNINNTI